MMKAELSWKEGMQFSCNNHGILTTIDAASEFGGKEAGPTPKELILNAMMGCTAMDVVSMLKKMRQDISEFNMTIETEKTTQHPIHFKTACLNFNLKGNIEVEKLIKAVDSSLSKYCGVNYMISKSCKITFKVTLNDQLIKEGPVTFIEPITEE
ncbi:MAG: OsmC family protein [Bacteriovoracaceae bacterium]